MSTTTNDLDQIVGTALTAHCLLKDALEDLRFELRSQGLLGFGRSYLPDALDVMEDLCDLLAGHFGVDILKDLPPMEKWSKQDLRNECAWRELATSGTKAQLIDRLHADEVAWVEGVLVDA